MRAFALVTADRLCRAVGLRREGRRTCQGAGARGDRQSRHRRQPDHSHADARGRRAASGSRPRRRPLKPCRGRAASAAKSSRRRVGRSSSPRRRPACCSEAGGGAPRPGTRVARGQPIFLLFAIQPPDRDLHAEAARDAAAAEAELTVATQRAQRLERLLADGAASARAVEEARAQQKVAEADCRRRASPRQGDRGQSERHRRWHHRPRADRRRGAIDRRRAGADRRGVGAALRDRPDRRALGARPAVCRRSSTASMSASPPRWSVSAAGHRCQRCR